MNDSTVPAGMTLASRAILKENPVTVVRKQTRNDIQKHKDGAEHFSELFIKVQQQLPNAQSYVMTFVDFMNILMKEIKLGENVENPAPETKPEEKKPESPSEGK